MEEKNENIESMNMMYERYLETSIYEFATLTISNLFKRLISSNIMKEDILNVKFLIIEPKLNVLTFRRPTN